MQTELEVSPTGRLIDNRGHLLATAHEQCRSLRFPHDAKSDADRLLLVSTLKLQDALLRKALTPTLPKGQSTTPPAMDFTSMEQRIADTCGIDPHHPYGR